MTDPEPSVPFADSAAARMGALRPHRDGRGARTTRDVAPETVSRAAMFRRLIAICLLGWGIVAFVVWVIWQI